MPGLAGECPKFNNVCRAAAKKKLQKYAGVLTTAPRLPIFGSEQMCIMFAETESPWVAYCEMVYKNVY